MIVLSDIERLRVRRRWLAVAYVVFVMLFGSSCAMAATDVTHNIVQISFGSSALAALPLYLINVLVHWATSYSKAEREHRWYQAACRFPGFPDTDRSDACTSCNQSVCFWSSSKGRRRQHGRTIGATSIHRFKKSPSMSTSR